MFISKRHQLILVLGLVVLSSATLAAQSTPFDLTGITNPCNGSVVSTSGTMSFTVVLKNPGLNISVQFAGTDTAKMYQTTLSGNATFPAAGLSYDIPFHSVWTGTGAPSFSLDGVINGVTLDSTGSVNGLGGVTPGATACIVPPAPGGSEDEQGNHDGDHQNGADHKGAHDKGATVKGAHQDGAHQDGAHNRRRA